ncbi:MAG TPA: calcium-binding protein, partial [Allosphingosinicella sp.]|nr:calcium-binding protein [Allosphingosinicella sp.]
NGDAGTDTLVNFENVTGSPFDDTLVGTDGPNVIDGGAGADTMTGGDGNDVYHVDVDGDTIVEVASEGVDEVRTGLATYTLAATLENLTATNAVTHNFRGNGGDNRITGGTGRDIVHAQDAGADTLYGLEGNDTFYLGAAFDANDHVDGDRGIDSIIIQGDYPNLVLGTGTTSNIVGIETISLVPGHFTDFGGSGTDFYSYDITTLDANVATGAVFKVNGFYLRATESFTFDGSAETGGRFILLGGQGLDDLTGGGGNDLFIFGEDGRFGPGDRVAGGGGGDDIVYLRGDHVIDFNDPAWAGSLAEVESVILGGVAHTLYTSGAGDGEFDHSYVWNDAMLAGGTISFNGSSLGAEENFSFDGRTEASASFRLVGGGAVDELRGGGGADFISGGASGDTLQGNGGNDVFAYFSVSESNVSNLDGIQDFTLGDLIDLSAIDANSLMGGNQAFTFVTGAFTGPGQLRVTGAGALVTVEANIDGDAIADLSIAVVVADLHTLTATDFLL